MDGEPSAPWKSMPSAPDDSCSAKMKGTCHRSPFGMMFVPSTDCHGAALLTSFLEASRARTSARPARALESMANVPVYGASLRGSFAIYDRASHSWRTPQTSLISDLDVFSGTWPRWGTMRNGACWERPTLALHNNGIGFGSVLPTLTKMSCEHPGRQKIKAHQQTCISGVLATRDGWRPHGQYSPSHAAWFMGWPESWTSCAHLETDKFQLWLRSHGRR